MGVSAWRLHIPEIRASCAGYRANCVSLCAEVPPEERGDIFGYDVPAMWFYVNNITPPFRYFTMQTRMA